MDYRTLRNALLLTLLGAPGAHAALQPKDATAANLKQEVHWCGLLHEAQVKGEEVWFIYGALPLEKQRPTEQECEQAYHNPNRYSAGSFVLIRPKKSMPEWMSDMAMRPQAGAECRLLGLHNGAIDGFVEVQGSLIPSLRAMQFPQKCVSTDKK